MGGGGGGGGDLDWLGSKIKPHDVINGIVQWGSAGLVGYGEDGKIKPGMTGRAFDETLGEITGRNMGREMAFKADQRVEAEMAARQAQLAAEQEQARLEDLQASGAGGAMRRSVLGRSAGAGFGSGMEKDFLGL